jgi:hypothetical protein
MEEEWRMQYDALDNLRVLNKYKPEVLDIANYAPFIA